MLPVTIFRQLYRYVEPNSSPCYRLNAFLELYSSGKCVNTGYAIGAATNCLNRYVTTTGFIRISLLNINQYRNWDIAKPQLRDYGKKQILRVRALRSREFFNNIMDKKREILVGHSNIVEDIRTIQSNVRQKVYHTMEEVIERENIVTIPNLLTISRAVLSPCIGYFIIQGDFSFAMRLLVIASVTDLMDGQIARRWPMQASKFGSFLDPMADKLLIGSLVISMCYCNLIPIWLAGTVLFRDIFLMAAGFIIRYISLPPPRTFLRYFDATHVTAQLEPTFISKVNTAVQLATIGISLGAPIWSYLDNITLQCLWYLTTATTIAAAMSYILRKDTFKILKFKAFNRK